MIGGEGIFRVLFKTHCDPFLSITIVAKESISRNLEFLAAFGAFAEKPWSNASAHCYLSGNAKAKLVQELEYEFSGGAICIEFNADNVVAAATLAAPS